MAGHNPPGSCPQRSGRSVTRSTLGMNSPHGPLNPGWKMASAGLMPISNHSGHSKKCLHESPDSVPAVKPRQGGRVARSDLENLYGDDDPYLRFHADRMVSLTNLVLELVGKSWCKDEESVSVLDIGPSFQTGLIAHALKGTATVDVLGKPGDPVASKFPEVRKFIEYDLNETPTRETWIEGDSYDVIVFGEVLEHLHTAPETVLGFLRSLLKINGVLVIQTPNAASLPKRLALLRGRNPYEKLRTTPHSPGHFRESTAGELIAFCRIAQLEVDTVQFTNYWEAVAVNNARSAGAVPLLKANVLKNLGRAIPQFREGLTVVARRVI